MTKPWIAEIESALDAKLPAALRALYERSDGEEWANAEGRPMRLMTSSETTFRYRDFSEISDLRRSCPFWIGNNGDLAALYVGGPLSGRIYYWEHIKNYPSEPVAFRSMKSFLASLNAAAREGLDWYEIPTDYFGETSYYTSGAGICKRATAKEIDSDRKAFQAMLDAYRAGEFADEDAERFYATNAIVLAPLDATEAIVEFLDSQDGNVQEAACKALGHRRYAPAIARLERLACEERGNGQTAAVGALGKIGSEAARESILRCVPAFSSGHDFWLADALKKTGCETRFEEDKRRQRTYYFRLPNAVEWTSLR